MRAMRAASGRRGLTATVIAVALVATASELASGAARAWFAEHSLTTSTLVGLLMIAATYLVVERALSEREHERWREAAGPLLDAIAVAGARTDAELRIAASGLGQGTSQCEWLGELLARYQAALSGTPELIVRWHAALSLVQHARAAHAARPVCLGADYETAWQRFRSVFGTIAELDPAARNTGKTWLLPAVRDRQEAR